MERPDFALAIECLLFGSGHVFRLIPNGDTRFPPGVRQWRYLSEEDWQEVPPDMLYRHEPMVSGDVKEHWKQVKLAEERRRKDYLPPEKKRKSKPKSGAGMYGHNTAKSEEGYV